jgi:hypothetical protein
MIEPSLDMLLVVVVVHLQGFYAPTLADDRHKLKKISSTTTETSYIGLVGKLRPENTSRFG